MTEGKLAIKPARPEELVAAITQYDAKISSYTYGHRRNRPNAAQTARALLKDAWLLIKSWEEAFKECDKALLKEHTEPIFIGLEQYFGDLKVSPFQINAHSNPEIKWNVRYS